MDLGFRNCEAVSNATMIGTCLTTEECTSAGGEVDGNCASGTMILLDIDETLTCVCFFRVWCLLHPIVNVAI